MSTHHSADMTPSDSSELLNAEEAERRALAERVFASVRKPMSKPKFAVLVVTIALVFSLGSWGIIRGVDTLMNEEEDKPSEDKQSVETVEVAQDDERIETFNTPDSEGVMHLDVSLPSKSKKAHEVTISFPADVAEKKMLLHIHAPASNVDKDAQCIIDLQTSDFNKDEKDYRNDYRHFATYDICPTSEDGSVDVWLPVAKFYGDVFRSLEKTPVKFLLTGWGASISFDLMEYEKATPVDWDGTSPFNGKGPAFIRTTSGAYAFTLDSDAGFEGVTFTSQLLDSFDGHHFYIATEGDKSINRIAHPHGAKEAMPGYIFLIPNPGHMDEEWTLTEIDTGDLPAKQ
ncbi:MAG: hypothetical protein IKS49_00255 [Actinomycetaceae bacterium]|nr:hypothetical protein [Actinomycetaceae bacterium]